MARPPMMNWAEHLPLIAAMVAEGFTDEQIGIKLTRITGKRITKQLVCQVRAKHAIKAIRTAGMTISPRMGRGRRIEMEAPLTYDEGGITVTVCPVRYVGFSMWGKWVR